MNIHITWLTHVRTGPQKKISNPARAAREARAVYPYFEFKDQPGSCPTEKTWRRQRGGDLAEKAMDAPAKTKVSCFLILSH